MGLPTASANAQRYPTYPCRPWIMGHILIFVKFCRFVGTEYAVDLFRVQNYCKFLKYANFALIFYINIGTKVVIRVDVDMKFGELIDIVETFEVSAEFLQNALFGCGTFVIGTEER